MESDAREDWGAADERVQQVIEGRYPVVGMSSQALSTVMAGVFAAITVVTAGGSIVDPSNAVVSLPLAVIKLALALVGVALAVVGWQLARRRNELAPAGSGYSPVRTLTSSQRRVVRRQTRGRDTLTAEAAPIVAALLRERLAPARTVLMTVAGLELTLLGNALPTVWLSILTAIVIVSIGAAVVVSHRIDTRRLAAVERAFPSV
ncbi:hypothetical protein [Curtobacterium sp. Leaf261]|uniref:hypothetical protein n=1 Tax=Curtobacterium sp. Leaf261 TaxID=1736311 RepID=UPI0007007205|nr:hypothetical protein [Curtobacterium sp. Leaf261]KQO65122.1 hypothetical protein ASF23_03085 [Curtobacterium sp. Leaf261]